MRDNTFTPGPWTLPHFARPDIDCECGYVLTDGYMGAVATVHVSGKGNPILTGDNPEFGQACANARLIAAAPDMYDALWETIELSDRNLTEAGRTPECQRVYDLCLAALKKAGGE